MKKSLALFLAVLLAVYSPPGIAQERTNIVVADCTAQSLSVGNASYTYVDRQGRLCTTGGSGGGGGGGGDASAAKQDEQTGKLTTIDVDTGNIATSVASVDTKLSTTNTNTGTVAGAVSSSRVQVNPIVGQAGIAAGTGVDGATVPRFSLATNVPLPAGTNVIGHVIADSGSTTAVTQATGSNLHTVVDSGTLTTVSTVTNLSQLGGAAISMNTGVRDAGTQRVTIATNDSVPVTGTVTVTDGAGSLNVIVDSGTTTVTQGTATNLKTQAEVYQGGSAVASGNPLQVTLANTGANATAVKVDGSAVTQPVSGTVTVTDGAGALNVICDSGCSGGTQYTQDGALTVGSTIGTMAMGRASAAAPTDVSADNDAVLPWYLRSGAMAVQLTNAGVLTLSGSGTATGALRVELPTNGTGVIATVGTITNPVTVTDGTGALNVICDSGCSGGTQYTQDAALTVGSTIGTIAMGRASAAVPTDVSADNDAVMPWYLRSGAMATQPTYSGVLAVAGNGASGTGVQRVTIANDSTGILAGVTTVSTVSTVTAVSSVNAVIPGTGATNLGKAIDTATGATDTGVLLLATRDDALTTLTPVDGDNVQLRTNSTGALWVQSSIIDAAEGAAVATNPVPAGCVYRSSPGTLDTGDVGYPLCDTAGRFAIVGAGTAGTAAGGVVTVQGVASMTPILTNPGTAANWGIYVEDAGETAAGNLMMAGTVRRDTAASSAGTTGDNATLNTDSTGLLWARDKDPCSGVAKTFFVVNISTSGTTEIANAVANEFWYICSINIVTAAANNVVIAEDDTDGCGSISAGITGGTTAATGWNFPANGGLTNGNGASSVAKSTTANRYLCILTSASTQTSGVISYVSAP